MEHLRTRCLSVSRRRKILGNLSIPFFLPMKKTQSTESKRSIKILILFCGVVGLLIAGSLIVRLLALMRESTFDAQHRYTISFVYKNNVDVVSLDPVAKSMTHMVIGGKVEPAKVYTETGIVPDTIFILSQPFEGVEKVSTYTDSAFFHKGGVSSDLSVYDLFRLSLFAKGISSADAHTEEVSLPIEPSNIDILVQELFLDQSIADENKSVSVVNGAGVVGLGKRLERALENRGYSVISVTNADKVATSTQIIFSGEKSYSIKKIENILGAKAVFSEKQSLSDIIITLGKDQANSWKF